MSNPLTPAMTAMHTAVALWDAGGADLPSDVLLQLNAQMARAARLLDAARASVAAEIARRSRPELGAAGLAKQQGFRNPGALISAVAGSSVGDAVRLVKVGEATAPRTGLDGVPTPAKYAHVAEALAAGRIGASAAAAIVTMLDRIGPRADAIERERAESSLVASAPGLATDALHRLILRAEAWLVPADVALREDEVRAERSLHLREDQFGRLHLRAVLDPAGGAPVKVAIESLVAARLRAQRDLTPTVGPERAPDAEGEREAVEMTGPPPTIPQMQADALTLLAEHVLGCAEKDLPVDGATVVVRIDLADPQSGDGVGEIDGIAAPVSVGTVRRMAAGGGVIPCVLGGDSEILDWGRNRRLFTRAQKLALVERDGGCAMCGAPPSHTKVHHLRWWARDAGPTDLANGVLLCESCHHRIHDNGWEIRVEGPGVRAKVWFIPPGSIDPERHPRLGGRARYDFAA